MKALRVFFPIFCLALPALGNASIVEFTGTAATKSIGGVTVNVYPEAKVDNGTEKVTVKLSGTGVREKKVAFLKVNVYAATSYVQNPADLTEANPMDGIKSSKTKVLQLTMLRNLSGDDVRTAFEDALDLNGVDLTSPGIKSALARFNTPAKPGEIYTIAAFTKGADQVVNVDFPAKTTQDVAKDLADDFWKVWFGTPIDDGMKALQKALVGK